MCKYCPLKTSLLHVFFWEIWEASFIDSPTILAPALLLLHHFIFEVKYMFCPCGERYQGWVHRKITWGLSDYSLFYGHFSVWHRGDFKHLWNSHIHWRIQGAQPACSPKHPDSLIFTCKFSAVSAHWTLAPPLWGRCSPPSGNPGSATDIPTFWDWCYIDLTSRFICQMSSSWLIEITKQLF